MMSDFVDPPFLEHHHEIDFFWGLSEMFCQDVKDGLPWNLHAGVHGNVSANATTWFFDVFVFFNPFWRTMDE